MEEDDDDMFMLMEQLTKIEQKIEALLPLWANNDTPAKARIDFDKAKTGLLTATDQPQCVKYDLNGVWHRRFNKREQFLGPTTTLEAEGTDRMQFLINSLDAAFRLILMEGKNPRDEIVSLLKQKLELYEKKIPASLDEGSTAEKPEAIAEPTGDV